MHNNNSFITLVGAAAILSTPKSLTDLTLDLVGAPLLHQLPSYESHCWGAVPVPTKPFPGYGQASVLCACQYSRGKVLPHKAAMSIDGTPAYLDRVVDKDLHGRNHQSWGTGSRYPNFGKLSILISCMICLIMR